ncbi:MAG: hypothetical protein L0Y71_25440, partial [Gemmataceae bacterium]|nr:hypothetical protein [Gemmataceae bacterium]
MIFVSLGVPHRAAAAPLDDIFAELERRRAATRTVHYQISGTHLDAKFGLGEGPLADHEGPCSAVVKLDFENKRVLKR